MNFTFDAVFPIIKLGKIQACTKRQAGPKALAAQTYKSPVVQVAFLESGKWAEYSHLFNNQIGIVEIQPHLSLPSGGRWLAYPYAIDNAYADGTCATWIETTEKRSFVRHVRLYQNEARALIDNQLIAEILAIKA